MFLGMLQNEHPELMALIKSKLIQVVQYIEDRQKAKRGEYWYREFLPNDPGLGGTAKTFHYTYTNNDEEELFALGSAITVPTANAYIIFGAYLDADPGVGGYIRLLKNNIEVWEIPARIVYECKNPLYMYLDFDHVVLIEEQETFDFKFKNIFGADQICYCFPIMFRIASRDALHLRKR